MIDEVILRCFYAQLVRFLCPCMDNKRQPRAARPILGSLFAGDSGHTWVSRTNYAAWSQVLPDPIFVSNLPGHSFRFKQVGRLLRICINTKVYKRAFNSLPGNIAVKPAPVKASRSYFSSYRGSPQTKVSGGSNRGSQIGEPPLRNRIRF